MMYNRTNNETRKLSITIKERTNKFSGIIFQMWAREHEKMILDRLYKRVIHPDMQLPACLPAGNCFLPHRPAKVRGMLSVFEILFCPLSSAPFSSFTGKSKDFFCDKNRAASSHPARGNPFFCISSVSMQHSLSINNSDRMDDFSNLCSICSVS